MSEEIIRSIENSEFIETDTGELEGYACTWDFIGDGYKLEQNAFEKSLAERLGKIPVNAGNHTRGDKDVVLDTVGMVVRAEVRPKGLWVAIKYVATDFAQAVRKLVKAKGLLGMSVNADVLQHKREPNWISVLEAKLKEITLSNHVKDLGAEIVVARAEPEALAEKPAAPTQAQPMVFTITDADLMIRRAQRRRLNSSL
jgi:HK97 family phage prohead protease